VSLPICEFLKAARLGNSKPRTTGAYDKTRRSNK
jgi:hypothetical protein